MASKICIIPEKIQWNAPYDAVPHYVGGYQVNNNKYINLKSLKISDAKNDITDVDNIPIEKVKLINSHGVAINDQFSYSIDSDFMADAILNNCVSQDGEIIGPFVFYKNKYYSLVRVGSALYQQIESDKKRRTLKKIKIKDLKVGSVYATLGKRKSVYLGSVDTYNNPEKLVKVKNKKLFYQIDSYNYSPFDKSKFVEDMLNQPSYYRTDFASTHSFIECVDQLDLPNNIIQTLRENARKAFKKELSEISDNKWSLNMILNKYHRSSKVLNVHVKGDTSFQAFDIKKYLMLM
jgi:hypothetical protein